MAITEKRISTIVAQQLPDFINAKYVENAPSFRRFIELYYLWLEDELEGNTVYHIMNSEKYRDVDNTLNGFLTYFKRELLPFFPERTELELTKILKGAKEFYLKKGTEESIVWLFRVLFNKDASVFYPKENILKASDGKWQQPKSIKISDSPLLIQIAGSTRNYYAPNAAPSAFHSQNTFVNTIQFENSVRRNSTLLGFASYKIWVDSVTSATTLYNRIVAYLTDNAITGTMTDSDGNEFTAITAIPLVSTNRTGYGQYLFEVVEVFYEQSPTSDANQILYNPNFSKTTIEAVLQEPNSVTLQYDGIQVFELGNIENVEPVAANSLFVYSGTQANVTLSVTDANTPAYLFGFAKEERGTTLLVDTANNSTLANTNFGDDKYLLQYKKAYRIGDELSLVKSTGAANIAMVGVAFKERQRTPVELLEKRRVNGLTSTAFATVEKAFTRVDEYTKTQYTELFLTDISGEFVNNELVEVEYLEGTTTKIFTERIFGFVGSIVINPNYRGLNYKVGDPVVIFGGEEGGDATTAAGFSPASAYISDVTSGRIISVDVTKGGYGYRADPNTVITVVNDPSNPEGVEANIVVGSLVTGSGITLSLANDVIQSYASKALNLAGGWGFPKATTANVTSGHTLTQVLNFENITFYPIQALTIINGGHDFTVAPTLSFNTVYQVGGSNVSIASHGFIANVEVLSGGTGYTTGQALVFSGSGSEAAGTITAPSGAITGISLTNRGYGYTTMPTVSVSGAGSGAVLQAYGFNDGVEVTLSVDDIGKINAVAMQDTGFGYSSTPEVSLKVIDVYVSNLSSSIQSDQTLTIFQGATYGTATFYGNIDATYTSTSTAVPSGNNTIRVYNYNGSFSPGTPVKITETGANLATIAAVTYGNGLARANVNFVDGTVTYPGFFFNTDGFLSADKKLQDSDKYHNFSYILESDKALNEYKQSLFNIVHPAGMQLIAHTRIAQTEIAQQEPNLGANIKMYRSDTEYANTGPQVFTNYYKTLNANANIDLKIANTKNIVANTTTTNFSTIGPSGGTVVAGDRIVFNFSDDNRKLTLIVADVASSSRLNTTQPVIITGQGRLTLNGSVYAVCSENVAGKILVNDYLRIFDAVDFDTTGTDAHVLVRQVAASPTNNIIQLSATASGTVSNTNLGYWIDPDFRNVPFRIERDIT